VKVPATEAGALARWMHGNADSGSLELYLRASAITIAAMATEAARANAWPTRRPRDALVDGCVLAEFRLAPLLWEQHGLLGGGR
jgi:adenosine deaminase